MKQRIAGWICRGRGWWRGRRARTAGLLGVIHVTAANLEVAQKQTCGATMSFVIPRESWETNLFPPNQCWKAHTLPPAMGADVFLVTGLLTWVGVT